MKLNPLLAVLCFGLGCSGPATSPPTATPPNIILIVTDDQALGDESSMPKLQERVADRGITFTNAFVTTPSCGPSRASILRGQYAHNHGIVRNELPSGFPLFRALGMEESTIATWLQGAGYRTVLIGKYMNHYGDEGHSDWEYVPPGWDEWFALVPGPNRGTTYINYQLNENGTLAAYTGMEDFFSDVVTEKVVDFIRRRASDPAPFFMHINPIAPHGPARWAPRHDGLFNSTRAPRPPSFNEADVNDKPMVVRLPPLTAAEIAAIDELYRKRQRSLQAVDDMIESIFEVLESIGAIDRTYVVFMSDNGFHLGQHRLRPGKGRPYEEDLRIPLIAFGPGIAPGQVVSQMVLNIDIAPTLADLAGAYTPSFVDGRSMKPLLLSGLSAVLVPWRQAFLAEHWHPPSTAVAEQLFTVARTEKYAYIEWPADREFYDLDRDPFQLRNSIGSDPQLIQRLQSKADQLRNCRAAQCQAAENDFK